MAKTIFPPISLQQTPQTGATLLAVQSTPLSLTASGVVLFGSQIALPFGKSIVHLSFQASFHFPLLFSMECPGLGAYIWSLSGEPSLAQTGQTAYATRRLLITRDVATGAPVLNGSFTSLIPSLGVQSTLIAVEDAPASPILLEGHNWIFRLSSTTGQVDCAWLEVLEA